MRRRMNACVSLILSFVLVFASIAFADYSFAEDQQKPIFTKMEDALQRVNEIRSEAKTEGIKTIWGNNDKYWSSAENANGNALKWSKEGIDFANTRAEEASESFSHTRPNGEGSSNSVGESSLENLYKGKVSGDNPVDMVNVINLWYGEKAAYLEHIAFLSGERATDTEGEWRHYNTLIMNSWDGLGLGVYKDAAGNTYVAGEFAKTSNSDKLDKYPTNDNTQTDDTTPPVITPEKEAVEVEYNTSLEEVLAMFGAEDDVDGQVEVTIKDDGGYDPEKAGEYNIVLRATDNAGNEATKTITVSVKANPPGEMSGKPTVDVETPDVNIDGPDDPGTGNDNDPLADIKVDKTATDLDDNLETTINLKFPGKKEDMAADVVFVLDKSGMSAEVEIYNQAKAFVENLSQQATEKDIEIKVGVVLFNNVGNIALELTDVRTGKDAIINAMNRELRMGTNLHAGLLAGKKLLDDDTAVSDNRKHMVVISDGATYLWSKNDDYTVGYTRSYGNPADQGYTNRPGYVQDWKGGLWEYMNRDLTVGVPDGEQRWSSSFATPNTFDPYDEGNKEKLANYVKNLGNRIAEARQRDADYEEYDYEYNALSAYLNFGRKTTPIENVSIANVETAAIKTSDLFDEIDSEYSTWVYYSNVADYNGSPLLAYMKRNSGGLSSDFADITKEVLNFVDKGSTVEDFIGKDFDFINELDRISLKVGDETLTGTQISENEYGFGDLGEGKYRYKLVYEPGDNEKITLHINETVSPNAPVDLQYCEKLVNVPTEPGKYELDTNEEATLKIVDSEGKDSGEKTFPKPKVTYETGKVITTYVDLDTGEEIEDSDTQYGRKGKDYKTDKKDIADYEFVKDSGNTTGTFTDGTIEVIYYYKKVIPETPTKNVYVTKNWSGDVEKDRPDSINVKLLRDGKEIDNKTTTADQDWSIAFEGLAAKDDNGNDINYLVEEVKVDGYKSQVTEEEDSSNNQRFIITNTKELDTPTIPTVDVSGKKTWAGDKAADRPNSITVRLYADGKEVDIKSITNDDNWSWSFKDLAKFKDDRKTLITYTIKEDEVAGYITEVKGYDLVNTKINEYEPIDDPDQDQTEEQTRDPGKKSDNIKTGDSTVIGLFIALLLVSLIALVYISWRRKYNN